MALAAGATLGPYEIVAPLGAGGMGEVYRARDARLGRDVAIKILPEAASRDPSRLRRLELEARAAGALNHPNVLSVYDVGVEAECPYVVSELLEGEPLHERIRRGPLPLGRAVDFAVQIARGLAAAHEKGIVHRDLKPENVFVTRDGHIKILDFGLAKLDQAEPLADRATGGLFPGSHGRSTTAGTLLGTVGYISPEQVRGEPADARSDLFSFGVILYEMLTGGPPFQRDTAVESLHAILREEPAWLSDRNPNIPPALDRVVVRCLEKSPDARFQSARDLAFHLEAISGAQDHGKTISFVGGTRKIRLRHFPWRRLAAIALVLLSLLGAFALGRRFSGPEPWRFQQVTFRRGSIQSARFGPDGQSIVYGAAWEGRPVELFLSRPESPESRPLEPRAANILSISRKGDMALLLLRGRAFARGTLARAPFGGGAPRALLEDVEWADWAPQGDALAVVRHVPTGQRLEFPIGTVLYETRGWISHARVSPRGDRVAFIDHPAAGDNRGSVQVVKPGETPQVLSDGWKSLWGLAWSPDGSEVWFTASEREAARSLYAVSLSGRQRLVNRVPLRLTLQDISPDGARVLMSQDQLRRSTLGMSKGDEHERDLSWLDYSNAKDISNDGRTLLFSEDGEAGGSSYAVYVRPMDGSPAVRLGEGKATALSPDARWVLSVRSDAIPHRLMALPTGAGEVRELPRGPIERYEWAGFFPDGRRVFFAGNERGGRTRLYVQDLPDGAPRAIGEESVSANFGSLALSPDGATIAAVSGEQTVKLFPVNGGAARRAPGVTPGDVPVQWTSDGKQLYVFRLGELPSQVTLVDMESGARTPWRTLMPADASGVLAVTRVRITPDGSAYVYTFSRILSDLFLAEKSDR
jgi:eukaryotic-like serine/threonine-protein kinase